MADNPPLLLPAIKGRIGIRFYYSALMTFEQVSRYIRVGEEIYTNKKLSDMMQRALRTGRQQEIADYLLTQPERFFNAMVVGVYDGKPDWKPFAITAGESDIDPSSLRLDTVNSFGFLRLSGNEELFPLDGQHRLAGIREALRRKGTVAKELAEEEITVIFIPHDQYTAPGRERSRRLFTVLNKRAKAVDRNEIIALDEDDIMAIVTRELVEGYAPLRDDRTAFTASNSLPPNGQSCLTTIGTLYDVLLPLFRAAGIRTKEQLENNRPTDEWLGFYRYCATTMFDQVIESVKPVADFVKAKDFGRVASRHRSDKGGHLLFRPAGLRAFGEAVAYLVDRAGLPPAEKAAVQPLAAKRAAGKAIRAAVVQLASLNLDLAEQPFTGILWDPDRKTVQAGKRMLARDLMLDMLGEYRNRESLRRRYAKAVGREGENVRLPSEKRAPRKA